MDEDTQGLRVKTVSQQGVEMHEFLGKQKQQKQTKATKKLKTKTLYFWI